MTCLFAIIYHHITMEYRSRNKIIISILQAAADAIAKNNTNECWVKQTDIMHKTDLSYVYFEAYLSLLQQKELIEYNSQDQIIRITDKGIRFLQINNQISKLFSQTN
jgi:predicted transcriptional regulator